MSKKFICIALISVVAVVGLLVLGIPSLAIYPFNYKLSQQYASFLFSSGLMFVSALIELVFGVRIVISGDTMKKLNNNHPTVIVMNHSTWLDWLYLLCVVHKFGSMPHLKVVLESKSKNVPIFGWILQMSQFIFIEKNWTNSDHAIKTLTYYCNSQLPVQLLIFPEGQILSESKLSEDNAFAWKNDLQTTQYVLRPLLMGFINSMQVLRDEWHQTSTAVSAGTSWREGKVDVCDITAGFIGDVSQGQWPREIHFHIKHYPSSSLPSSDEELSEWLRKRWSEKDELLTQFYETKSFPGPFLQETWWPKMIKMAVLVKWLVLCAAVIYSLIQAPLLMTCVMGTSLIIHIVVSMQFDGWDEMILRKWEDSK